MTSSNPPPPTDPCPHYLDADDTLRMPVPEMWPPRSEVDGPDVSTPECGVDRLLALDDERLDD